MGARTKRKDKEGVRRNLWKNRCLENGPQKRKPYDKIKVKFKSFWLGRAHGVQWHQLCLC